MTKLIDASSNGSGPPAGSDRLAPRHVGGSFGVEFLLDRVQVAPSSGQVDPEAFALVLATEFERLQHGGVDSLVAVVSLFEVAGIRRRLGDGCLFDLVTEVSNLVRGALSPHDLYNVSEDGEIVILARRSSDLDRHQTGRGDVRRDRCTPVPGLRRDNPPDPLGWCRDPQPGAVPR